MVEKSEFEYIKDELQKGNGTKRNLLEENANIGELKKYLMSLNNIQIRQNKQK